jgi:hypothetical protein
MNLNVTFGLLKTLEAARTIPLDVIAACDRELRRRDLGGRPEDRAKVTCASIVVNAWHTGHGSVPTHNSEALALACDALWLDCLNSGSAPTSDGPKSEKVLLLDEPTASLDQCGGTGDAGDWSRHTRTAKRKPAVERERIRNSPRQRPAWRGERLRRYFIYRPCPQPISAVSYAASALGNALASFRSRVSNPSVNQP